MEKAALPLPPPLPCHFSTRFHHKAFTTAASNMNGYCCATKGVNSSWDRLFDEAYRADVSILTSDGTVIYAHASILGVASPVLKAILKKSKGRVRNPRTSISIRGAPSKAVRVFVRFLYSSCYGEEDMKDLALPLLALSHAYAVPHLKRLCESWLEQRLINTENALDIFQLALLCDAPRLSLISHRFILKNLKAVSATDGWRDMKTSHPVLEKEILSSIIHEDAERKEWIRKANERKMYLQLHEAMEALVHICREGCRNIGPHKQIARDDENPCGFAACEGLEALARHFAACKMRGEGGCVHCKRMWQTLDLHSRLCANSDDCKVPLCSNFRQRRRKQSKKEDMRWRILVKKIVRSKSITGAPFFSLESR